MLVQLAATAFSPATPYKAKLDGGKTVGYYASLAEAQAALNAAEKAKRT